MEQSAGTIVVHEGKYLLLHYQAGHWDFAKGHIETGETLQETALRELKEETGLEGEILDGFKESFVFFFKREGKLVKKEVTLFVTRVSSQKVQLSSEHQGFGWFAIDDALVKLTFKNAREVLSKAHQWMKKGAVV